MGARLEWLGFEDFSAAQLYEMLQFRQAIFVVEQCCAFPDLDGRDERAQHLLASIDDELAGYLRLISYPDEAHVAIGRVAVAVPRRRHGVARFLMAAALSRCGAEYPDWGITLTAQTYLVPFYQSLGFRETSAPFDDYGLTHVEMALADRRFDG